MLPPIDVRGCVVRVCPAQTQKVGTYSFWPPSLSILVIGWLLDWFNSLVM